MNTKYEYIYFYVEENSVAQAYRSELVNGTIEYEHNDFGSSTCFKMSKKPNKNAKWVPAHFGEKTELVSEEGYEYDVYSDPRDAFGLGYGN